MTYPSVFEMTGLQPVGGAARDAVDAVERTLGISLPEDYRDFLTRTDGLLGFVGRAYVNLWSVRKIVALNDASGVREFAPGLVLLGTDGGGTGYGYIPEENRYAQIDLIDMDPEPMGDSLVEFFQRVQAEALLDEREYKRYMSAHPPGDDAKKPPGTA